MDRTQKWMGSVGCLGQIENIKRQSLIKIFQEKASIMFPTLTSAKATGLCIPNEISIFADKGLIV